MLALYRSARQADALDAYAEGERYLRDELGLDPGTELRNLRDAVLRQEPSLLSDGRGPSSAPPVPAHNLPVQFTSFIGRKDELAELDALLTASRLVTLTGVGGAGKSRLALEVAAGQLAVRPDGVWLVELGAVLEAELVDSTVAQVLRVPEHPQHPLRHLIVERLRGFDALLLIDNCEHLVATVSQLVRDLLRACPNLRVLCTSRERLGITGETVRTVTGLTLPCPDDRDAMAGCDAVRLFEERASAVQANQRLDGTRTSAVAEICRRLDGLPLAIELAAARTTILAPAQIVARLDRRFGLLTRGSRDALPQHQTLRAVVDWSYELLDPEEQRFFDCLAVFVGGFTLEAAEIVCAPYAEIDDPDGSAALMARLVDKSLVAADSLDGPEYRYRLLETLREYGLERLAKRDAVARIRDAHAAYCLALAQRAATGLRTGEQRAWLQRLSAEHGNMRAALDHAITIRDHVTAATIAGSVYQFWDLHGHYAEGRRWLGQARNEVESVPPQAHARVLLGMATLTLFQGDLECAFDACEEARIVAAASGDDPGLAHALQYLGLIAAYAGDLARARDLLDASLATARQPNCAWEHGYALVFLAILATAESDFDGAMRAILQAEKVLRSVGDQEAQAYCLLVRGLAAWSRRDDREAAAALVEALRSFVDLGAIWGTSSCLLACGLLLARRPAAAVQAVRVMATADALRESAGVQVPWWVEDWLSEAIDTLNRHLGAEVFRDEWSKALRVSPTCVVETAIAELGVCDGRARPLARKTGCPIWMRLHDSRT